MKSLALLLFIAVLCALTGISCASSPQARFDVEDFTVEPGLEIQFNDRSGGKITAWLWDFGDGSTSSERNPVHTYNDQGDYLVTLTVSNKAGINSITSPIRVSNPLLVDFTASKTTVSVKESIKFEYQSTERMDDWLWDFGDGTTSGQWKPVHSYSSGGVYTVTLTVSNKSCSETIIKEDYITVKTLSVKTWMSTDATDTGEYIEISDAYYEGDNVYFTCEITGFEQQKTNAGYEVWLEIGEVKVGSFNNLVLYEEESPLEVHDVFPEHQDTAVADIYLGSFTCENDMCMIFVEATVEDIIGDYEITTSRGCLVRK